MFFKTKLKSVFPSFVLCAFGSMGIAQQSFAQSLSGTLGDTVTDFSFENKYKDTLKLFAAKCIRQKKIVFVNVKVYEMYVHMSDPTTISKKTASVLDEVANQKTVTLRLKFLRNVDSEKVKESFNEGLKINNHDANDPLLQKTLATVLKFGEYKESQILTIIGHSTEKEDVLILETSGQTPVEISGAKGFLKKIYSMWFGKTTDAALEKLKECLIKEK